MREISGPCKSILPTHDTHAPHRPHSSLDTPQTAAPQRSAALRRPERPSPDRTALLRGDWVRSLFTPFDARAHFILYPCRSPHGGRLKDPMTWAARARPLRVQPSRSEYGSAQGVRKWEGQRSRRAATRATAAPRPERTNKAFDFAAWKGGVRCSDAVQPMAAWLARCGRVPVQRAARSHATVSGSPIREELGR